MHLINEVIVTTLFMELLVQITQELQRRLLLLIEEVLLGSCVKTSVRTPLHQILQSHAWRQLLLLILEALGHSSEIEVLSLCLISRINLMRYLILRCRLIVTLSVFNLCLVAVSTVSSLGVGLLLISAKSSSVLVTVAFLRS